MQPISYLAEVATQKVVSFDELQGLRIRIVADAAAAILVLTAITTVSVCKPWGKHLIIGFALAFIIFILPHLMKGGMHH